ncbi:MAG: site-2 protease family protein [Bacteroidetes bacterium]|nr:site-2 protease family protein [Bacteroidota bacterium]
MKKYKITLHIVLFILTFFTTTLAGVLWLNYDPTDLLNFYRGLPYSISILLIIGSHEFGHYFAARYHKVESTLPYFIPFPPSSGFLNFGTLGAIIKTRHIPNTKVMFDIGIAGPLVGFIFTLLICIIGITTLPGKEFIESIHPNYFSTPQQGLGLEFGDTILFNLLVSIFSNPESSFIPPMSEIYHYPFLCAGWFGLFVTAMNLLPIGQLDGGHISYAMFKEKHIYISYIIFSVILISGLLSLLQYFAIIIPFVWSGWLFWGLVLFFIVKLEHPKIEIEIDLDFKRMALGYFAFFILLISITPVPFNI